MESGYGKGLTYLFVFTFKIITENYQQVLNKATEMANQLALFDTHGWNRSKEINYGLFNLKVVLFRNIFNLISDRIYHGI